MLIRANTEPQRANPAPFAQAPRAPVAQPQQQADVFERPAPAAAPHDIESLVPKGPSRTRQRWADSLWYVGHVLTTGSLASRFCLPAAITLVVVGQICVIISRPIGRSGGATTRKADDTA